VSERSPQHSLALPAGALDCAVAGNEHGVYCLPRRALHRPVAQAVLSARTWEPDTLALVCGADPDGDVVHAGTFFGDFIPALARSRRSARPGEALLATGDATGLALGGASHLIDEAESRSQDTASQHSERVPLTTIDEALGEHRRVAIIQLDVEGHERDALAGAMRTIERCRPLIVLESLPEAGWLREHLAPLGYRVTGSVDANSILRALPPSTAAEQRDDRAS
jgi:hypothetical protein